MLGTSSGMTIFLGIIISKTALINTEGAGTEHTFVKGAFIGGVYAKNLYIRNASAVKVLGIDLQSF